MNPSPMRGIPVELSDSLFTLDEIAERLRYRHRHSLWRILNKPGGIKTVDLSPKCRRVRESELRRFLRSRGAE